MIYFHRKVCKSRSYGRCFSLQPKAVEAWALIQSCHEFLWLRTLNFESIGDTINLFLHMVHLGI